jgi:hypothetical protein
MENIFYRFGKFLIDNAEELDEKFETDREDGRLARTPNVFRFAKSQFYRHGLNENKKSNKIKLNEFKSLVKKIIKEEIAKTTFNR